MSHNEKCIFCPCKTPSFFIKYKWEELNEFFKATVSHHHYQFLIDEFESKGFWCPEAVFVEWKIRYQGDKYRPKIKSLWEQLAEKGIETKMYREFKVNLPNTVVKQFED